LQIEIERDVRRTGVVDRLELILLQMGAIGAGAGG
jgi:hypothetical protein